MQLPEITPDSAAALPFSQAQHHSPSTKLNFSSTEAPRRTLAEHSHQIQSHGSTLHNLLEQQRHSSQQLDQMVSLLQHALNIRTSQTPEGANEPPVHPRSVSNFHTHVTSLPTTQRNSPIRQVWFVA
ncbi:hypothetical protein CHARACLAT_008780 [Characodon lateralis]|uniref:Uncharacterized protein n=1 Tax=Characodon lateralis TaxID=208331 RepID=A0ABU7ESK2_9TELE|nr:hypothetical protein [Characodon lateralis]